MKVNVISIDLQKFIDKDNKNNRDMIYLSCPKSFDFQMVHKIVYGYIPKKYDKEKDQYVINMKEYLKYLSFHGMRPINPLITLELDIPNEWNIPVLENTDEGNDIDDK